MAIRPAQERTNRMQDDVDDHCNASCLSGDPVPDCDRQSLSDGTDRVEATQPVITSSSLTHSISALIDKLRLEQNRQREYGRLQSHLYQIQCAAARTARLLQIFRPAQKTLAECIKCEDKNSFVNLYNALQEAVTHSLDLPIVPETQGLADDIGLSYPATFMDTIPSASRDTILNLVLRIKTDPDFVANRLAALSQRELLALLPDQGHSKSSDSVFGPSYRTTSRTSRHLGFVVDSQTESLSSSACNSGLELLVCAVRGQSNTPLCRDRTATDLWATVCARLVSEHKAGSEKLVPALIDMWAASSRWIGRERLRLWIVDVLRDGCPFLERDHKQSFRVRAGLRDADDAQEENRFETFLTGRVLSLLEMIAEPDGSSVIPDGARVLCHAIHEKLKHSTTHQQAFPSFVLNRWLFASFIPDALGMPEMHGLFTDHYIADNARQRLLREIAGRCHKASFDVAYSWKLGTTISSDMVHMVQSVAEVLVTQPELSSCDAMYRGASTDCCPFFISLSAADIGTIVDALYPPRTPASDQDSSTYGLQSSASSVSGFSLFQGPASVLTSVPVGTSHNDASGIALSGGSRSLDEYCSTLVEKLESQPWENIQIREARASVDDAILSRTPASQDWTLLLLDSDTQGFRTVRDVLFSSSAVPIRDKLGESLPGSEKKYHASMMAIKLVLLDCDDMERQSGQVPATEAKARTVLLQAFQQRVSRLEEAASFVDAHVWHRRMNRFRLLTDGEPGILIDLLDSLWSSSDANQQQAVIRLEQCRAYISALRTQLDNTAKDILTYVETAGRLRDKMWYTAEARTSAAFDEARAVAHALKVMGKPKQAHSRSAPALRHWAAGKAVNSTFHLKSEVQVFELLSAPNGHGGPNKLSDDQSKALATWLERNAVENFCKGEERLQRVCMEVRKAISILTSDQSTTWSSSLFSRMSLATSTPMVGGLGAHSLYGTASRTDPLTLWTNVPMSIDSISSASSHPLSARSSRDYLDTRSPTLTNKSSGLFWSPALSETRSPSSATSMGSALTCAPPFTKLRQASMMEGLSTESAKEQLRRRGTSLLLSDLAVSLFPTGSETDLALWTGLGYELTHKHLRDTYSPPSAMPFDHYDFSRAFERLLHLFSATLDPYQKLDCLHDIDKLLVPYMALRQTDTQYPPARLVESQEVDFSSYEQKSFKVDDTKVAGFRRIFCEEELRPLGLFRDLQYIASLVETYTLDNTPRGKAFWNAAVAALSVKQEVCRLMVETADSIIAYYSSRRGNARSSSAAQQERDSATFPIPRRTPSAEDIGHYQLSHAADLLLITAKNGDPVAQRELATLYLTNPELMDHVIAPLSRPRDVFKEELEGKWRKNQDPARCDPATMCVAHHWMTLSSRGGDALAKEYLRQREEMDRLG